jgi:type IV pilus assembly protein PilQ
MKKGFFLLFLLVGSTWLHAQEILNVNFVQEGEISKLIIETSQTVIAERFHVTEDKQIILDIRNVKASPKLLRGIDTSEFPGSTVYISGYKKPGTPNDIRFAVQLRDNARSLLETRERSIVLSIENRFGVFSRSKARAAEQGTEALPGAPQQTAGFNVPKSTSIEDILSNLTLSGPKKYIGKRISINVRDIPVADVLNMIADTSGFNIIIDKEVMTLPPLTLSLTNIPWDEALDTIMTISKLVASKTGNILIVKTVNQASLEAAEEIKAALAKETLEPLVTRIFLINYATLAEISGIVKDYLTPERAKLQIDQRTNSIIVKDTVDSIERIRKIIETLDTQTPQILIEAKVVEASESYSKRIGLTRGVTFGYDPISPIRAPAGPGFSFSTAPDGLNAGVVGMTIGVYRRLLGLDFNLQLMESESRGRIISTPRVVTQNKKAATITSTEQTSFRVQQMSMPGVPPLATFENAQAMLSLNVTPQVTNDGAINLTIVLSKSAFGNRPSEEAPPNQSMSTINTNVLVDNGSTVVIGGIYQTSTLETISGIPFLKDLPLVGWLFRSPYAPDTNKSELIIFMTPRIMNQEEAGFSDRQARSGATDKI